MGANTDQFVDPAVSKAKFERQVSAFHARRDEYIARGCWLLKADFPDVLLAFCTPQLQPPSVVFGARINFGNYDIWPPSVQFVNPFSGVPYKASQMLTVFKRQSPNAAMMDVNGMRIVPGEALLQSYSPDDIPFLCVAGVREYHHHPRHTGDSWLLRRQSGAGTLHSIVNLLLQYGVEPLSGYNFALNISVTGYEQTSVPA